MHIFWADAERRMSGVGADDKSKHLWYSVDVEKSEASKNGKAYRLYPGKRPRSLGGLMGIRSESEEAERRNAELMAESVHAPGCFFFLMADPPSLGMHDETYHFIMRNLRALMFQGVADIYLSGLRSSHV